MAKTKTEPNPVRETAVALAEAGAFNGRSLDFAFREVLGKDWKTAPAKERAEVREVFFTSRKSAVESASNTVADADKVSVKVGARVTANGGIVTAAVVRGTGLPVNSPEYKKAETLALQWRAAADSIAEGEFSPDSIREALGAFGWSATAIDAVAKFTAVWNASRVPIHWLENNRVTVSRLKAEFRALKP